MSIALRFREYIILTKFRLSFLVVISAITGYLMADKFILNDFLLMIVGGFMVTGSSNAFNQVLEREFDKLMTRTQNRPLVKGTLSVTEAMIVAILLGVVGLFCLYQINRLSVILGFFALFSYVAIYTPMKRVSPWAVFVGAFPGAIPPMLGYVAAEGSFGLLPGLLFFVQFMWQFPHFWAIAWVLDDDYKKAGYHLLPSRFGRNPFSSLQIIIFTLAMILASASPWVMNLTGHWALTTCMISGFIFYRFALKLHHTQEISDARKLMFASFFYLPIIQFIYVFDKL
ncbi:MAG: heme o synthase [Flavobacteriales bacterium]|nr:heme o synthase [Flavobacteriales bacterium]